MSNNLEDTVPATVLIVEDEPAIAELLAANIKHAGYHTLHACNVETAAALVAEVLPDLIVLDWMLPGASGLAFLRKLRANSRTQAVRVIMLSARTEEEDALSGLDAGADDYMAKPFSPKELVARIKAVMRREMPSEEDVVSIDRLTLDPTTHRVYVNDKGKELQVRLGPTEFKVLHFFLRHPERVHSRGVVRDRVWGDLVNIEERTVDVHIKRLRAALRPSGYDAVIETVRGSGYRLTRVPLASHMESAA